MGFENRVELYKAIEHERGKPLITYFTSRRQSSGGRLSMDVIPEFCEHIRQIPEEVKEIDLLIKLRHKKMNGKRHDYFDHFNIVGWTFEGLDLHDGMAVLINDGPMGEKMMYVGKDKKGQVYQNLFGAKDETVIDENGNGLFKVDGGNLSVYINKVDCRSF